MASLHRRMKWTVLGQFSRHNAECLAGMFLMCCIMTLALMFWQRNPMNSENDGTFIDLSEARQKELIEDWKRDKEMEKQLGTKSWKQKQELDRVKNYIKGWKFNAGYFAQQSKLKESHQLGKKKITGSLVSNNEINVKHGQMVEHKVINNAPMGNDKPSSMVRTTNLKEKVRFFNPAIHIIEEKNVILDNPLEGGRAKCLIYDLKSEIHEDYECQMLTVKPVTKICLYPDQEDIHVSAHIREEGMWEPHIIKEFQNALYGDPTLGVIDIGANIGQYTLLAAQMGHKVVAVEPFLENLKHLHQAVKIGKLEEHIVAVQNGISNERKESFMKFYHNNQGGVAIQEKHPEPGCLGTECDKYKVSTVFMDDLLEVINFEKAIIKIDIEGHEHKAFVHAKKLLDSVYVPVIFMEWMKLREYYGSEITESSDKDLVFDLVAMLTKRGYQARSSVTYEKLDIKHWYGWTDDIMWQHELAEMM